MYYFKMSKFSNIEKRLIIGIKSPPIITYKIEHSISHFQVVQTVKLESILLAAIYL